MAAKQRLAEFRDVISKDLDRSVQFWLQHSHDEQCGGYFQCLDTKGEVYETSKMTWLLSRQVWMYARLYHDVPRFHKAHVLEAAKMGADFIMKHVKMEGSMKCLIFITREGKPIKSQRSIFSEIFYLMAMAEMYRVTGDLVYKTEAVAMMSQVAHWVREDGSGLGDKLAPPTPTSSLATPMMMLCAIDVLETAGLGAGSSELAGWAIRQVKKHVQRDGTVVLETVSEEGQEVEGAEGRLVNPGHAIEAGWFLLQRAQKTNDLDLQRVALDTFISQSFQHGWDPQHGGIFYFVDIDGRPPLQFTWDMKLYWPHNESLIAFLMAYKVTGDEKYLNQFAQVFDYSYKHFADPEHGEWFGYLNRQGEVSIHSKGGHWKGCFHVPRSLMMCEQMLNSILEDQ